MKRSGIRVTILERFVSEMDNATASPLQQPNSQTFFKASQSVA
jgi:hypothetical protein